MPIRRCIQPGWVFVVVLLGACTLPARALQPDEILLLVNQNVTESRSLAEFYRTARNIPAGHILALDLPRGEDIAYAVYHGQVVPQIREFLQKNNLENQITCIVTFYGVPLRIGARQTTDEEKQEVVALQTQHKQLLEHLKAVVGSLEAEAKTFDPQFQPGAGSAWDQLTVRAAAAVKVLANRLAQTSDETLQNTRSQSLLSAVRQLHGLAGLARSLNGSPTDPVPDQVPPMTLKELIDRVQRETTEFAQLQRETPTAATRTRQREIAGGTMGAIALARVVQAQIDYLNPASSVAAFDSELSLLWSNSYRSTSWLMNPLYYRERASASPKSSRALMVMRLDAPQSGMVRDIILSSLKAERDGLKGRVVLDCRGMFPKAGDPNRGYAAYDQSIRNLAQLIRTKTKLGLLLDESETVLPPASAMDVALYCGWYSVRNYVPACRLNAGAVGFHVASFELISLKNPQEKGWVRGLLNDGIAATLGSVAEPYLTAFPAADDFFPLLLTGKFSLAEVYWKTVPFSSWMMAMIGDPLYTPYKNNPALKVEDLPPRLKGILETPTTLPSAVPAP